MASCFSHPAVPLAIACWVPCLRRPSLLIAGSLLSAAPDLDAFAHFAGAGYGEWYGHRGATHTLLAAVLVASLLAPRFARRTGAPRSTVWAFFCLAWLSHPLVDMATDGGIGLPVLWPFVDARWFWPWRPIEVSPIAIRGFFTARGLEVILSEALWLWLPAVILGTAGLVLRRGERTPAG